MQPDLQQAYLLMISNNYENALQYLTEHQDTIFTDEYQLKFIQAILSYRKGNTVQSYQIFDKIYYILMENLNDEFGWWHGTELIDSFLLNNDAERAMIFMDLYLSYFPNDPMVLNEKGLAYYLKKDYENAAVQFEKVLPLTPDNIPVIVNLGLAYSRLGNLQKALPLLENAINKDDDNFTHSSMAVVEIIKNIFQRSGECDSCAGDASCCKEVKLQINEGHVDNEEKYLQTIAYDPRNINWKHTGISDEGRWIFNCDQLQDNGKCASHDCRPQICRDFPTVYYDRTKFEKCSYKFTLNKELPPLSKKTLNKVIKKLEELGRIEEIEILKNQL